MKTKRKKKGTRIEDAVREMQKNLPQFMDGAAVWTSIELRNDGSVLYVYQFEDDLAEDIDHAADLENGQLESICANPDMLGMLAERDSCFRYIDKSGVTIADVTLTFRDAVRKKLVSVN